MVRVGVKHPWARHSIEQLWEDRTFRVPATILSDRHVLFSVLHLWI